MSLAKHSAPGSAAAFSYQFERALLYLAKSTAGSIVGIETDDDVAIRRQDGLAILEQDKHSIQTDGEPFGNRSKDLWNTLKTWIEALDSNELVAEKSLFLMVTNKKLPDCIAHQIGRAKTDAEINACINALDTEAKSPPEGIKEIVKRVMQPASRSNLHKLIFRCRTLDALDSTAGDELHLKTIESLPLPEWCRNSAESILDELLGWVHRTTLLKWQKKEPAWIERNHFINQFHSIIASRQRRISRERAEHLIPVSEENVGERKGSLFVKQLYLITEDNSIVDTAIREFIRCNIEKSRMSEEGNITDGDWLDFESTLLSRWNKIRARVMRIRLGAQEEDIGFEIFTETTENHRERLAGCETEQCYLTSGTYHLLAESIRVGWHPQYEKLIE